MDYADLTYLAVIPSIYSVLEPTLAITLACVPLLRPLLGGQYSIKGTFIRRDPATTYESGASSSAARQLRKTDRVGFQTLDELALGGSDSSSQVELRPIGPRFEAGVSTNTVLAPGRGLDGGPSGGSTNSESADERPVSGIIVRHEWEVKEV